MREKVVGISRLKGMRKRKLAADLVAIGYTWADAEAVVGEYPADQVRGVITICNIPPKMAKGWT